MTADTLIAQVSSSGMAGQVRRELERRWPEGGDRMADIARYAMLAPGKLLRPLLLVASAEAVGGRREQVLPAAVAVEYLHVASLVHDDIIDQDELRRGRPAVHARYGAADAIVAGDALILTLFDAVAECASLGVPDRAVLAASRVLARAGEDLCRGQITEAQLAATPLDSGSGAPGSAALEAYLRVAALKTAALFRGTCRAGALLGGGSAEEVDALTEFAEHLGLAFQMYDDLLPFLAEAEDTGKPSTSDAANLRPTFPVLIAYREGTPAQRERLRDLLAGTRGTERTEGTASPEDTLAALREVLAETGAVDLARAMATEEAVRARVELAMVPQTEAAGLLGAIADLAVQRDR